MEELEKEFEEMLIKTRNAELIDKYADLKIKINENFELALKTIEYLEQRNVN
jgi:hypothetical protein